MLDLLREALAVYLQKDMLRVEDPRIAPPVKDQNSLPSHPILPQPNQ